MNTIGDLIANLAALKQQHTALEAEAESLKQRLAANEAQRRDLHDPWGRTGAIQKAERALKEATKERDARAQWDAGKPIMLASKFRPGQEEARLIKVTPKQLHVQRSPTAVDIERFDRATGEYCTISIVGYVRL